MPFAQKEKEYGRLDLICEIMDNLYVQGQVKGKVHSMVVDKSLYVHPAKGIRFKITPDNNGHSNHYSGVVVEVFSSLFRLDSIYIPFEGLLIRAKDDRPDHVGPLHIWASQGSEDWYIGRPTSIQPLIFKLNEILHFWTKE